MTLRYISIARDAGVEEGLAARLADPLWMLARQWQFGEFRGDDAGSATLVTVAATAYHPSWWRPEPDKNPAAQPWQSWTVLDGPLESLIEAEPDTGAAWLRLRIRGGVRARRALLTAGLGALAPALTRLAPWPSEPHTTTPADTVAIAATPDGAALAALVTPWQAPDAPVPAAVSAALGATPAQLSAFADAMRSWLAWWTPRSAATPQPDPVPVTADPPAWDRNRLEHRGSIAFAAKPDLRLHVDRYPGGGLDWYGADVTAGDPAELAALTPPAGALAAPQSINLTGVPLPTTFAGMAAPRFWEFEDADVDFGSIDASPADLARVLLVEYTTVYGNDWFTLPIRLPIGSLVHVDSVSVADSFGGVQALAPFCQDGPGWRLYSLQASDDPPDLSRSYFWCAPTLSQRLVSPELERVDARRDEMANTAWVVVDTAPDSLGRPYNLVAEKPPLPPVGVPPHYLVQTPVAPNCFPLAPQPVDIASILLQLEPLTDGTWPPSGVILAGNWWIYEEELGRAGLTLDRTVRRARWHDGSTARWIGRNVWPGIGEMSSGLLWDTVIE